MPVTIRHLETYDVIVYGFCGPVKMADMVALRVQEANMLSTLFTEGHSRVIFDFTGVSVLNVSLIPLLGKLAPLNNDRLVLSAVVADNSYAQALATGLSIMAGRSLTVRDTLAETLVEVRASSQDAD